MGIHTGLLFVFLLGAVPAEAIITFNDSNGNTISPPSLFDGVGLLTTSSVYCSATLLSTGDHALTAAHCVAGSPASLMSLQFQLAGGPVTYGVDTVEIHPSYALNGFGFARAGDLAVLKLSSTADPALARYDVYTGVSGVGEQVTLAGRGNAGSGAAGETGGLGALRIGQNVYDGDPFFLIGNTYVDLNVYVELDFDNGNAAQSVTGGPGGLGLGTAEGFIGSGDSGGPSFISSNGNLLIAGIHSWRGRLVDGNGVSSDIDGITNGTFGEIAADTRVSTYATWVHDVTNVPEPATVWGVALALCVLLPAATSRLFSAVFPLLREWGRRE
ncbi:MAG: trypsin-like serine protease [Acidobacteria bacterium]|nr:trypsin-like serine protease [Acidobacteriota bacterium]